MYGFIVEKKIMASDVDSLNASATCTSNVDGGMALTLGAYTGGSFVATIAGATASTGVYMAYNPTEHLTQVGTGSSAKYFAGLTADPRDYTNLANRQMDIFKPQVGDIIAFTDANFGTGTKPDATTNKYITTGAAGIWTAASSAIAAGKVAFTCLAVETLPFPQGGAVGMEFAPLYVCQCVAN